MARWTHDHGAPILLEQLRQHGLSATWAVVGVVMLDRLPDVTQLLPVSPSRGRDWFSFVPPGATEETAPEWFGSSLLRALRKASPRQEIGFHGFSHVVLNDPRVPPLRVSQEIERCGELARELGLGSPPFVFPRNGVAGLESLHAAGMGSFRGRDGLRLRLGPRWLTRPWSAAADFLGLAPALVQPRIEGGLVNIPGSLMVRHAGGWRRCIPDGSRLRRLRKGLDLVQRRGGILHVWLHPENLYFGRPRMERLLAQFLSELTDLASASRLRVLTMGDVAREVLASAPVPRDARSGPDSAAQ
jgi:hypothetical protein